MSQSVMTTLRQKMMQNRRQPGMDARDAKVAWLADAANIIVCPGSASIHWMHLNPSGRALAVRENRHDLEDMKTTTTCPANADGRRLR